MNAEPASLLTATDEQIMWRVKLEGDPLAFACLMRRWQEPIRQLCFRMTGDAHGAEDLAQTAFLRVFARRAEWQAIGRFSSFLWRVALNLCHDELRKARRRRECPLEPVEGPEDAQISLADEAPSPAAQAEARDAGALVRQALLGLAPHYREVLVLRHYEGLKFHEIATVLDIPEGTVKSRMAEGLSQLARHLHQLRQDYETAPGPARVESRPS